MNKKANFVDIAEWLKVAFMLMIVFGVILVVNDNFNDGVQAQPNSTIPNQVKETSENYNTFLPKGMDMLFTGLFMVFVIFSVIAARLIPSTPMYIFVTIFAIITLVFASMVIFENVWQEWSSQPVIATHMAKMLFFPFFMDNLRYFVLFYGIAIGVAILSKESG